MEKIQAQKKGLLSTFRETADQDSRREREEQRKDAAATELLTTLCKTEGNCTKCELGVYCVPKYNYVQGTGSEFPDVLIVHPRPPTQESIESTFLEGRCNTVYLEVLKYVPKEKIRITNAIRCASEGSTKTLQPRTKEHINACRQYLENEIALYDPKIVLLLGPIPLYAALRKSDLYYNKYFGSIIRKTGRFYICTNYIESSFAHEVKAQFRKIPYLLEGGIETDKTLKTKILKTHEEVDAVLNFLTESGLPVVFDIETASSLDSAVAGFADSDKLLGIGFSWAENKSAFIPVDHDESPFKDSILLKSKLKKFLVSDNTKCAHNALFDVSGLAHFLDGIKVKNLVFDTMLAHHVINPTKGTHGLKYLITQYTKFGGYDEQVKELLAKLPKEERSYGRLDLETLGTYCNYDCIGTYILWGIFDTELQKQPKLQRIFDEITFPCHELILDLKHNPWIVDEKKLDSLTKYYNRRHKELFDSIQDFVKSNSTKFPTGININSSQQLVSFLMEDLKFNISVATKKGSPSSSKEAVEQLRNSIVLLQSPTDFDKLKLEFLDTLLLFRSCEKIKSTYIEGLTQHIVDGKIYTEYLIEGTETARLSSRKPNMQNVHGSSLDGTKETSIKSIFVAPEGYDFVIADYSQIELRNLANITRDENLTKTFLNNINSHQATAGLIFNLEPEQVDKNSPYYRIGKMINFLVVYGGSPKKMAMELGKVGLTYDQLQALADYTGVARDSKDFLEGISFSIINTIYSKWTRVKNWQMRIKKFARINKKVETPFGRVRYLREMTPGGLKINIANQALNSPVQSVSSDCLLLALLSVNRELKKKNYKSYIVGTIHDSGIFYVHKEEKDEVLPMIKKCMEKDPTYFNQEFFLVPLVVNFESGSNWSNVEPIEVK